MPNQPRANQKKLLIVATEQEARYFLGDFLNRNGLTNLRIETGQQCLEASARERFGLILARVPLPDISLSALTTGLNQRFSLNNETALMLLAEGRQYEAALALKSPRVQVIDVSKVTGQIGSLVGRALGIALRAAARLDVEIAVETEHDLSRRHCRTRDISRSGMLLDSTEPLPIGTEFAFNFTLPQRFTPIHGRAQVVRHEGAALSPRAGMGVRFIDFPEGAEVAIGTFVEQSRPRQS